MGAAVPRSPTSPPQQALAHPTWAMGLMVTTNSATLVNKGLEVIEAHLLFDVPYERIDVAVHPQSIVHSMVEFIDGSTIAQASPPDMRLPISLGLDWPHRIAGVGRPLDWTTASSWNFEALDDEAFPSVALAKRVGVAGGSSPAVFNAANEQAVSAFHARPDRLPGHRRHHHRSGGRPHRAGRGTDARAAARHRSRSAPRGGRVDRRARVARVCSGSMRAARISRRCRPADPAASAADPATSSGCR